MGAFASGLPEVCGAVRPTAAVHAARIRDFARASGLGHLLGVGAVDATHRHSRDDELRESICRPKARRAEGRRDEAQSLSRRRRGKSWRGVIGFLTTRSVEWVQFARLYCTRVK